MIAFTRTTLNHAYLILVALLHIHIMFYKNAGTAEARKPTGCPFKVAQSYFGRKTALLTSSFLFRDPRAFMRSAHNSDMHSFFKSSEIVRFAMDPESLSELEMREHKPKEEAAFIPTSLFFNQNLDSYMPKTSPTSLKPPSFKFDGAKRKKGVEIPQINMPVIEDTEPLEVVCVGLSHHTSSVDIREKLAIPESRWTEAATDLCQYDSIKEASVLSTCNRFEIYLSGPNQHAAIRDAVDYLHRRSNGTLDHDTLKRNLFMLAGEDAIWHLMRVSAGLDSLVIGENQILAQVKRAHKHGLEPDSLIQVNITDFAAPMTTTIDASVGVTVSVPIEGDGETVLPAAKMVGGRGGKVITKLLSSAVRAGQRVRHETGISKGAVSVSSAAAEFSAQLLSKDCDIYSGLKDANIAIIGAGKMTRLLLTHLVSKGVSKVTIINRSFDSVRTLQQEFPTLTITMEHMRDLYQVLTDSDIVFPSTASVEPIIHAQPLIDSLSKRTRTGGLQLIDISVPRNVHPDCGNIVSVPVTSDDAVSSLSAAATPTRVKVSCYNVDDIKQVVSKNTAKRRRETLEAEVILKEEMSSFRKWQQGLLAMPTLTKLKHKAETVRLAELAAATKHLKTLTPKDQEAIEKMTKSMVHKLLYGPMKHLRTQAEGGGCRKATMTAMRQMEQVFELERQ